MIITLWLKIVLGYSYLRASCYGYITVRPMINFVGESPYTLHRGIVLTGGSADKLDQILK